MTTIAAIKSSDGIYMAADSGVTDFTSCSSIKVKDHKLHHAADGRLLFGAGGSLGAIQLFNTIVIKHGPEILEALEKWKWDSSGIVTALLPLLYREAKERDLVEAGDFGGPNGFACIIAGGGELYALDESLSVCRILGDSYAIGSGADLVTGSLYSQRSGGGLKSAGNLESMRSPDRWDGADYAQPVHASERLIEALRCAEAHTVDFRGPIVIKHVDPESTVHVAARVVD